MRAPLKGKREDARRLAARLRDLTRSRGTGQGRGDRPAELGAAIKAPAATFDRGEEAAARLDTARRRLRSSITPRVEDDGE